VAPIAAILPIERVEAQLLIIALISYKN
jgi:hypothetical protein